MDIMEYTDRQLLELLGQDRESAAAVLLERYSGILWSVCARRLKDPEDIKECVNAVFADFCLRPEAFDPDKGSLQAYLCGMANLKALERYRRNETRLRAEEAGFRPAGGVDSELEPSDLEEAMSQLEPEDARIIRMKYYGGMTYPEIAKALGLKTETVKKRGQRSLSKLKLILLGLILALLIAGCAYIVHRYVYARGVGIYTDPEKPVYQMAETPDACTSNGITMYLLNAVYQDGRLTMELAFTAGEEMYPSDQAGIVYDLPRDILSRYQWTIRYTNPDSGETVETEPHGLTSSMDYKYLCSIETELPEAEDGTIRLELRMQAGGSQFESVISSNGTPVYTLELDQTPITFPVTLEQTGAVRELTELGTVLRTEGGTFLLGPIRMEEGWTILPIYPLELPEGYALSPLFYKYYIPLPDYEESSASLVGEDGTSYPVLRVSAPSIPAVQEYAFWLRDIPAGEYTLHIPGICYVDGQHPNALRDEADASARLLLELPRENDVWVPCDETVTFFDGSTLHISAIRRTEEMSDMTYRYQEDTEDGPVMVELQAKQVEYHYQLDYELTSAGEYPVAGALISAAYYHVAGDEPERVRRDIYIVTNSSLTAEYVDLTLGVYEGLDMAPPDVAELFIRTPIWLDDQEYTFTVTID